MIRPLAILLASLTAGPILAQLPTGTILGVISDPTGAAVPGAEVTVTNTETGITRSFSSDINGAYRFPALPVGVYKIGARHEGFKMATRSDFTLNVSQEAVVNFALEIGEAQQTVEVTTQAADVNTTNSTVGALVNENSVQDLPLNGRNLVNLTLLQPGVAHTSVAGAGGVVYSVNGAPIRSNAVLIDGAPMTSAYNSQVTNVGGSNLGVDGVREYEVVTNTFGAEYGIAMGSVTTIVSKGGTNTFHGDLFDYLRNSAMDSRSFFDSPPSLLGRRIPLYQRNQFGGAFGGPIRKDKTFFYGAYEELKDNLNAPERETVPAAACHTPIVSGVQTVDNVACLGSKTAGTTNVSPTIQPLLALFPSPNLPGNIYSWTFPQKTSEYYGQMRVDQVFSSSDSFFARYTADYENQPNPGDYPTIGISWDSKSNYSTVSESHIFSPTW